MAQIEEFLGTSGMDVMQDLNTNFMSNMGATTGPQPIPPLPLPIGINKCYQSRDGIIFRFEGNYTIIAVNTGCGPIDRKTYANITFADLQLQLQRREQLERERCILDGGQVVNVPGGFQCKNSKKDRKFLMWLLLIIIVVILIILIGSANKRAKQSRLQTLSATPVTIV